MCYKVISDDSGSDAKDFDIEQWLLLSAKQILNNSKAHVQFMFHLIFFNQWFNKMKVIKAPTSCEKY
mgnify:CR=1 FL=1